MRSRTIADKVAAGKWHGSGRSWTATEDEQLGSMPDGKLAESLGRSRGSVVARRNKLGIPAALPSHRPPRPQVVNQGATPPAPSRD